MLSGRFDSRKSEKNGRGSTTCKLRVIESLPYVSLASAGVWPSGVGTKPVKFVAEISGWSLERLGCVGIAARRLATDVKQIGEPWAAAAPGIKRLNIMRDPVRFRVGNWFFLK